MKRHQVLFLALVLVISIFPANLQAQAGSDPPQPGQRLRFERFPLDSNTVVSILQDSQGFIWFATELGGLYQYDGYTFTMYRHDPTNPHSLSGNNVRVIYEDRVGTLWFGTDSGLNKFDRETRQFSGYRHNPNDPHSLSHDFILSIYEDQAGVFWIGTIAGGINRFDRKTGQFTAYRNDPNDPNSLSGNLVWVVYEDRSGTLWVGTNNGLNQFDPATGQFTRYQHNTDDPSSLSQNFVMTLYEDQDGTFWVGTRGGLNKLDRVTGRFTWYLNDPDDPTSLSHNLVRTFLKDQTGTIWIGTDDGLNKLDETGRFVHYRHDAADPTSLSTSLIQSLYQDQTGAIWIGTYNGGVNRLDPEAAKFALYQHEPDNPDSLSNNNVSVLYEDRTGILWIGTNGGGLDRLDRATGKFTHYQHDPKNPDSLGGNTIKAIFEDSAGMLWVGLFRGGLDRFDPRTGKFSHYRHDPKNPDSLSSNDVRAVYEERSGILWIGTYSGGLNRLDRETGKFTHYRPDPQKPGSIDSGNIIAFLEDRTGTFWLGTLDAGLVKFDRATGIFTHYRHDLNNPSSLSNNQTSTIYEDRAGTLWIGTASGLNKFDPATRTFVRYGEKDGLANDTITSILEDDQGYLWISTNRGLSRFDSRAGTFRNYDVRDGLQSNTFGAIGGGIAACKNRNGELLFGGPNGFNAFYPDRLSDNPYVPPVVLIDFQIFNQSVPIGGEDSPLQQVINETNEITLSYQQSVFSFEFAALNYRAPEKNQYAYKLEGFDTDWNYVNSSRRFATYTNLNPGTYTFRVKASNNDGVWNEEGKAVKITITPPWWQTWWFYTVCVVGVLGIFGVIYQAKVNQLRAERQTALVLRESEARYRELADSITDVFFAMDDELRYTYWNKASEHLTGIPAQEALGKSFYELFPDTSETRRAEQVYREVLRTQQPQMFVTDYLLGEKNVVFEITTYPSRDGIAVFTQDITERKQAEQALRESEERLRQIASSLREAIWLRDVQTRQVLYVNPAFEELTGRTCESFYENPDIVIDAIHPDDKEWVIKALEQRFEGVPFDKEHRIIHLDGSVRWVSSRSFPVRNEAGEVYRWASIMEDITKRRQAEEALRESEERFRQVLESLQDVAYRRNLQTDTYDYMSPAQLHISGYTAEEILSVPAAWVVERIHPDDLDHVMRALEESMAGGQRPYHQEYRFKCKDGQYRWMSDLSTIIRDAQGRPLYRIGTVRDVTERKQAEKALQESEERYRQLFELESDAIFLVDNETGRILEANSAASALYGYSREELLTKKNTDLSAEPEDTQRVTQTTPPTADQLITIPLRFHRKRDGTIFPVEITGRFFIRQGRPVHIAAIRDITERKQAEEALRESAEQYRVITSTAMDGFVVSDQAGRFLDVNEAYCHMLGYSRDELLKMSISDIEAKETPEEIQKRIQRIIESGVDRFETCHRRKDGSIIDVEVSLTFMKQTARQLTFLRDVTERKRAEKQLKNQNLLLEQAVQEKQREMEALFERVLRQEKLATIGQIAGSIAHELRNPLGAVKQSAFFLKRLYQKQQLDASNPKVKEHLDLIGAELDISERVISDLLQMTRMKPPQRGQIDLRSIIVDAVEHCHLSENIHLTIKLQPELFIIWADPGQLRQVFINILTNAIQAIAQDGNITIKAKQLAKEKSTIIEIENDGIGIEPEILNKIFDPLYTTRATGTGLGLSICKQIIENHHGQISVSSQVGQGTTVTIILPGQDSHDPALEKQKEEPYHKQSGT